MKDILLSILIIPFVSVMILFSLSNPVFGKTSGVQLEDSRRMALVTALKTFLGPDWFVLDEGTHIHIDWRPQRPQTAE